MGALCWPMPGTPSTPKTLSCIPSLRVCLEVALCLNVPPVGNLAGRVRVLTGHPLTLQARLWLQTACVTALNCLRRPPHGTHCSSWRYAQQPASQRLLTPLNSVGSFIRLRLIPNHSCEIPGYCCSGYGYCDVGPAHCTGCQKDYGYCPVLCNHNASFCGLVPVSTFCDCADSTSSFYCWCHSCWCCA